MYIGLHVKHPLFLSDFNETWKFLNRLSKSPQIPNFMKIRPEGAELYHANRQKDRHDEAILAFRNFAKVPKNALNT